MKQNIFYFVTIFIIILIIQSCKTTPTTTTTADIKFRSNYKQTNKLIHETNNLKTKPFLKAHLLNGDIYILRDTWKIDTIANRVNGVGSQFNFNRTLISDGNVSIPIDSVSIFETNTKLLKPEEKRIRALTILAGVDATIGILCLSNPKACFGSCPTFYINEDDNFHYTDAEGFSNAIYPSLEYWDIDAMNSREIIDNTFAITMKNEALETHCIKDVKLLAYPLKKDERVFQTPKNDFYLCKNNYFLTTATASEGNITSLLKQQDREERFSYTDENNLSAKEEIFITFDNIEDSENLGLILHFRQTLMTTYLIYNAIAYMGNEVSDIFAKMNSSTSTKNKLEELQDELGDIDIYTWNPLKNDWEFQNKFYETGPIAINKQFTPLKNNTSNSKLKIKLVINKGLWRIDYLALTNIKKQINPLEIAPASIKNKGKNDDIALNEILSPKKHLISMPGDSYKFTFELPKEDANYELFLYSKGYYLEWMREHWLEDKNLFKLKQMIDNPKKYLRTEASKYKKYETTMEDTFWNSKIDTKTFSYYE